MDSDLREVMRYFATGVCLLSTYVDEPGGRRHDAITVNSLTSVSLEPPLVSVCVRKESTLLADVLASGVWALSILDVGADDIARTFAQDKSTRAAALEAMSTSPGEHTGALVVDSLGWLECSLREPIDAGDHVILLGDVLAAGAQDRRPALIFLHGTFYGLGGCGTNAACRVPARVAQLT